MEKGNRKKGEMKDSAVGGENIRAFYRKLNYREDVLFLNFCYKEQQERKGVLKGTH